MANPRPVRRPGFFLISDSERCPNMTATAAAGGKMPNRLHTRLEMALPLVSGGSPKATAGSTGAEVVAEMLLPHAAQKVSPSDRLLPQPEQNELNCFPPLPNRLAKPSARFTPASCRPAGNHASSR